MVPMTHSKTGGPKAMAVAWAWAMKASYRDTKWLFKCQLFDHKKTPLWFDPSLFSSLLHHPKYSKSNNKSDIIDFNIAACCNHKWNKMVPSYQDQNLLQKSGSEGAKLSSGGLRLASPSRIRFQLLASQCQRLAEDLNQKMVEIRIFKVGNIKFGIDTKNIFLFLWMFFGLSFPSGRLYSNSAHRFNGAAHF